jgi:tetratricopeptide (TPR) repeat protein
VSGVDTGGRSLTAAELETELARASGFFERGELAQAESACRSLLATHPNHPLTLQLLGLIRVRSGDVAGGEELIRRSAELDPADTRLRLNLATYLQGAGRLEEAERVYRRVLQLAPAERAARHGLVLTLNRLGRGREAEAQIQSLLESDRNDPDAWAALGVVLENQGRLAEAEGAYRRVLAMRPRGRMAGRRLGGVLARMERSEEALAALERARALGARGFELEFSCGLTLRQLGRLAQAESAFAAAVELRPRHAEAQLNLARVRAGQGDRDFARALAQAVRAAPQDAELVTMLARLLLAAGQGDAAEQLLRAQLRSAGPGPVLRFALSQVLRELGRLAEAETEALELAAVLPEKPAVIENVVSILLSRGRPDEALPFIRAQRARAPLAQGWLAYEATAARLLGQPLYRELYDYGRLVRAFELAPPAGFASMPELNTALAAVLAARHRGATLPFDESLRHGRQSTRNLALDPDRTLQALFAACEEPVRAYLGALGQDAAHPFTARNRGAAQLRSAWAVRLEREGFHVNHYHEGGWISSAYYVEVPEEAQDANLKSGWLKLGEPRFPTPAAGVGCYVRPRAGQLVLFPSYMWHGTNPIHGPGPRTAIAFDALPA